MNKKDVRKTVIKISHYKKPLSEQSRVQLLKSKNRTFKAPITGYITETWIIDGACIGVIYEHVRANSFGKFSDGTLIKTSPIQGVEQEGDFWVVTTMNSRYALASFKEPEGVDSFQRLLRTIASYTHSDSIH